MLAVVIFIIPVSIINRKDSVCGGNKGHPLSVGCTLLGWLDWEAQSVSEFLGPHWRLSWNAMQMMVILFCFILCNYESGCLCIKRKLGVVNHMLVRNWGNGKSVTLCLYLSDVFLQTDLWILVLTWRNSGSWQVFCSIKKINK